jgi:hypothetical protein
MININIKSRWLKVVGGGLLLLSFIVQNFIYDYWDKEADEYYNSNRDFSDMSRSSLLYLNLYFNTHLPDSNLEAIVKAQYINMAAQKAALGQTVEIITRDTDKQARIDLCNALLQKSNSVADFNGYLDYIKFASQTDTYNLSDSQKRVERINTNRESFRYVFLIAYIIGSILLLVGIKYE